METDTVKVMAQADNTWFEMFPDLLQAVVILIHYCPILQNFLQHFQSLIELLTRCLEAFSLNLAPHSAHSRGRPSLIARDEGVVCSGRLGEKRTYTTNNRNLRPLQ